MKIIYRIIVLLILAAIVWYTFSTYPASLTYDILSGVGFSDTTDIVPVEGYLRSFMDSDTAMLYDAVIAAALNFKDTVSVPSYGLDEQQLIDVIDAIRLERPDIFWVDWSCTAYSVSSQGTTLSLTEYMTAYEATDYRTRVDSIVDKIIDEMQSEGITDDFDAVCYVHDRIAADCTYADEVTDITHTMVGALVNGSAVCDGYSRAFQYIMNRLGIENYLMIGNADDTDGERSDHAWNAVVLDGFCTNIDITWDDRVSDTDSDGKISVISHSYFGRSDAELASGRTVFDICEKYPRRVSYGWFAHKGLNGASRESIYTTAAQMLADTADGTNAYFEVQITDPHERELFTSSYDAGIGDIISRANAILADDGKPSGYVGTGYFHTFDDGTLIVICSLQG